MPVALVLLDCPLGHLVHRGEQEDVPAEALRLHTESDPGARLPEVIGAADQSEAPAVRNVALCGARLAQIFEDEVRLQVEELEDAEKGRGAVVDLVC